MHWIQSEYQSGMVSIGALDLARYTDFCISIGRLSVPDGTVEHWVKGVDLWKARNDAVEMLLADSALQWIFFIDDDHTFEHDVVLMLLSLLKQHPDFMAVGGLNIHRQPPFGPAVGVFDGSLLRQSLLRQATWKELWSYRGAGNLVRLTGILLPQTGMVVRREVFERMPRPWFEIGQFFDTTRIREEMHFSYKMLHMKMPTALSLGVSFGHLTPVKVVPRVVPDSIMPVLEFDGVVYDASERAIVSSVGYPLDRGL